MLRPPGFSLGPLRAGTAMQMEKPKKEENLSHLRVTLPEHPASDFPQDHEYCLVADPDGNHVRKIGFHEYGRIFSMPGLYEYLFHERLKCRSPQKVCADLDREMKKARTRRRDILALETNIRWKSVRGAHV